MPDRSIDHGEAVFAGHGLVAAGLLVYFGPAEARQDIGRFSRIEMAAVELGGHHHDDVLLGPTIFHPLLIGHRAHQIAAKRDKAPHFAFYQALYRVDHVHAVLGRRIEIE